MKKLLTGAVIALCSVALVVLAGCGSSTEDKTITVAATPTPHAEILSAVEDVLAEDGWELVVVEYTDYIQPNVATTDGEVDANYFQHLPYLEQYNAENGTDLVSAAAIHFEPLGIYAGSCDDLSALPNGAKVAVPNDATNEARALMLLEAQGLIKLAEDAGFDATPKDIVDNPKGLKFVEVEAAAVPSVLTDCAIGIINGNYAIGAGLSVADALATESTASSAAQTYANIICVTPDNLNSPKTEALVNALMSDVVKQYIDTTYAGSVVAMF